ncbi:MAG: UDP-N-acetylmuramoyl-tripeptide--D-alanyl-D-alanine ligase [bacterium]
MIGGRLRDYVGALGVSESLPKQLAASEFSGVSIDSRTVKPGNLFFCIVGETHDGHDFAAEALSKGAAAVVIDTEHDLKGESFISVPNTLTALGDLARFHLQNMSLRKVAVTGTNGKTTCKNMIAASLAGSYKVCATTGNFNNLYGVPLSIFEFAPGCEVAVFEFGMSTPGEISRLVEIVDPDIRVILNIGPAHLETMHTLEAIADAKFEILENAKEDDWAVLNLDDPMICNRYGRQAIAHLGFAETVDCEVKPEHVYSNGSGHVHFVLQGEDFRLPILGRHHLHNALAAVAVARVLDVPMADIRQRLESYEPLGNRMQRLEIAGMTIINDAYNANPVSVKGALETIATLSITGRRLVVFGDMLELGEESERLHAEVGERIVEAGIDRLLLMGEYAVVVQAAALAAGMPPEAVSVLKSHDEIAEVLFAELQPGDLVLLKASRALKFEKIEIALRGGLGRKN